MPPMGGRYGGTDIFFLLLQKVSCMKPDALLIDTDITLLPLSQL